MTDADATSDYWWRQRYYDAVYAAAAREVASTLDRALVEPIVKEALGAEQPHDQP